MTIKKWLKSKNNRGNIAIIVVVSLTVLIGMLALVVDGGYLYTTKDKYQNGVEAAALAGVWHMCDSDCETIIRQIAQENGIPNTAEDGLTVHVGYYDAGGQYDNFSEYGSEYEDFVADSDTSTSYNDDLSNPGSDEYEYNNAIMVSLNANISTFLAGIFGKEEAAVSAKAVAYAQRYLMISLGEGGNPGITTATGSYSWGAGNLPSLYNGIIHSNNDIVFDTSGNCDGPELINAYAYAHGTIFEDDRTNQTPTDAFGESGAKEIEVAPIDWDELRARAEANGTVIDLDFFENLSTECWYHGSLCGWYGSDEWGNCYFRTIGGSYNFKPHSGDHDGRTYFFDVDKSVWIRSIYDCCNASRGYSVTGMTMAVSNADICFFGVPGIDWGGDEADQIVEFYTSGKIDMGCGASDASSDFLGTFFRAEGDFGLRQSMGSTREYPVRKMRIIAGGQIHLCRYPDWFGEVVFGYNANFGPPCPPIKAHLGKLAPTGGL